MPSFTDDLPQFPARAMGNRGQDGVVGTHNLVLVGSGIISRQILSTTGVATGAQSGGIPNMTATCIAAGQYDIRFPAIQALEVAPMLYVATGAGAPWRAQVFRGPGIGSTPTGAMSLRTYNPTGVQAALPTGSTISLQLQGAPITAF